MWRRLSIGFFSLLLLVTCFGELRADDYSGTYAIQGTKGAITLTLQQDEDGNTSGTLKGGDLFLQLKGFPQEQGGLLGTASDKQGKFASYFMVSKAGDKLVLDLIEANDDGDPNPAKKSRIAFPLAGTGKAAGKAPGPTGDEDEEDDRAAGETTTEVAPPGPAPAAGAFSGTFKSPQLTIVSRGAGNDYTGQIVMDGQTFPFTATVVGDTLRGSFTSGNDRFDFHAGLEGSKLTLQTDDMVFTLQKQGAPQNPLAKGQPANPLAKAGPANPLAKSGSAKSGATAAAKQPGKTPAAATPVKSNNSAMPVGGPGQGSTWKIFKHPIGISVRYPPTWTLKEAPQAGGYQLTPPDVAAVGGGPAEVYFVAAQGAEGVTSVEDPRVAQYVEQQVGQLLPTMQRAGEVENIRVGTQPGISLAWEGTAPTGQAMRAQVMTVVLKGYAVMLFGIGVKDKLAARNKTIREVFASLAAGAGQKDMQLVGTWKFWSYKSSADGKYGTETTRLFRLLPDGTCVWSNKGESSGVFSGKDSGGNTTWTGGVAGQSGDVDQGTWSAGNGQLYVMWKDGSTSTWDYKLGGAPGNRRLFLQGSGRKPDEWMEVR